MIIDVAVRDDRSALIELLADQLGEHGIAIERPALERGIDGALADPARGVFFVARLEKRVVGVAYMSYAWALEHGGRSAWLEELYVLPTEREKGVGTKLLHAIIAHARAQGCHAIDLEVDAGHARAAHLYAREGFTAHRRQHWVKKLSVR